MNDAYNLRERSKKDYRIRLDLGLSPSPEPPKRKRKRTEPYEAENVKQFDSQTTINDEYNSQQIVYENNDQFLHNVQVERKKGEGGKIVSTKLICRGNARCQGCKDFSNEVCTIIFVLKTQKFRCLSCRGRHLTGEKCMFNLNIANLYVPKHKYILKALSNLRGLDGNGSNTTSKILMNENGLNGENAKNSTFNGNASPLSINRSIPSSGAPPPQQVHNTDSQTERTNNGSTVSVSASPSQIKTSNSRISTVDPMPSSMVSRMNISDSVCNGHIKNKSVQPIDYIYQRICDVEKMLKADANAEAKVKLASIVLNGLARDCLRMKEEEN